MHYAVGMQPTCGALGNWIHYQRVCLGLTSVLAKRISSYHSLFKSPPQHEVLTVLVKCGPACPMVQLMFLFWSFISAELYFIANVMVV